MSTKPHAACFGAYCSSTLSLYPNGTQQGFMNSGFLSNKKNASEMPKNGFLMVSEHLMLLWKIDDVLLLYGALHRKRFPDHTPYFTFPCMIQK